MFLIFDKVPTFTRDYEVILKIDPLGIFSKRNAYEFHLKVALSTSLPDPKRKFLKMSCFVDFDKNKLRLRIMPGNVHKNCLVLVCNDSETLQQLKSDLIKIIIRELNGYWVIASPWRYEIIKSFMLNMANKWRVVYAYDVDLDKDVMKSSFVESFANVIKTLFNTPQKRKACVDVLYAASFTDRTLI